MTVEMNFGEEIRNQLLRLHTEYLSRRGGDFVSVLLPFPTPGNWEYTFGSWHSGGSIDPENILEKADSTGVKITGKKEGVSARLAAYNIGARRENKHEEQFEISIDGVLLDIDSISHGNYELVVGAIGILAQFLGIRLQEDENLIDS